MPRKALLTDVNFDLNPETYEFLVAERARTKKGPRSLLRIGGAPESLIEGRIYNIFSGLVKYPSKEEYDFLVRAYACFPTVKIIKITPQKRNYLKKVIEEKGIIKTEISKHFDRYEGFDVSKLHQWLGGRTLTAREDHYNKVIEFIESY